MNEKLTAALAIDDLEDRDLALLRLLQNREIDGSAQELEAIANQIDGFYERTEGFIAIYETVRESDLDEALKYLEISSDCAIAGDEPWQQGELLSKIGGHLVNEGKLHKAREQFALGAKIAIMGQNSFNLQDSLDCSSTLGEIAVNLSKAGPHEDGLKLASLISNEYIRKRTLGILSGAASLNYGGMTMNERLYCSGLIDDFDAAIGRGDGVRLTEILKEVEANDETIEGILKKYGIESPEKKCKTPRGNLDQGS